MKLLSWLGALDRSGRCFDESLLLFRGNGWRLEGWEFGPGDVAATEACLWAQIMAVLQRLAWAQRDARWRMKYGTEVAA